MSPTDNQDDLDAAQDRARRDHESREQAADDRCSERMTPHDAWLYAASWGSFIRSGDPGACMYGFDERFRVQSEAHRQACLAWIETECRPEVLAHPEQFDTDELDQMAAFVEALKEAPVNEA